MVRQRHCRRLARNGKPAASLLTPSSSEPRTPAGKARVLDARKWLRERDGLSAGGKRIRTLSPTRDALDFETVFPLYDGSISRKGSVRALPGLRDAMGQAARRWH